MNKELINKYKAEFDHWLNEGSILARCITSDEDDFIYTIWYEVDSNELEDWKSEYLFNLTNIQVEYYKPQFIINDEYVEFRKALAEGKTVEYLGQSSNTWQTLQTPTFNLHITCYRIKPGKPKFKIGDYVRYIHSTSDKALQINNINCDRYYFKQTEMSCLLHELDLWQPKPNEWCWFYNNDKFALVKYVEFCNDLTHKGIDSQYNDTIFTNKCTPFIGELPPHLKDGHAR